LAKEFAELPHIASPREHAAFVLEVITGLKHEDIVLQPQEKLSQSETFRLDEVLEWTRHGKPLAYALGEWYFAGRTFFVNETVLIPRPDTETLYDVALEYCRSRSGALRILEVGVGCGAIIISIALDLPGRETELTATDISLDSLSVAKVNAERHGIALKLLHGSLLDPLPAGPRFDLIVSNPPYVAEGDDVDESVRHYEPASAYRVPAGQPGTHFHRLIAERAGAYLSPGGMLALEVGYNQADEVKELLAENGFERVTITPDLTGVQRVVSAICQG
jgi:release factor glutamine methyltransferase